ncbi:hypothetical protein ACFVUN_16230 [Kitasatospora griseola]|uniref:hypothetical protein n=1 Tax=Kitasatospora griseola TaxID=2064 RepID=UPI0036D82565
MACYPSADRIGRGLTALVQVDCPADRVTAVAAYDHDALTAYLLRPWRAAHPHPGLVEGTVVEGSRFSSGALDPAQRAAVAAPSGRPGRPVAERRIEQDLALIRALGADGRMPYAALAPAPARRHGAPPARRAARIGPGGAALRDASPRFTGYPRGATLRRDVPPAELPTPPADSPRCRRPGRARPRPPPGPARAQAGRPPAHRGRPAHRVRPDRTLTPRQSAARPSASAASRAAASPSTASSKRACGEWL